MNQYDGLIGALPMRYLDFRDNFSQLLIYDLTRNLSESSIAMRVLAYWSLGISNESDKQRL